MTDVSRPLTLAEALWRRVNRGGPTVCWLWTAGIDKDSYGIFRFRTRHYRAHRVAYALHHGEILAGLYVLHTCHTPRCCAPHHLYAGAQPQNMEDARHANRLSLGSHRPQAKLTEAQAQEIARLAGTYDQHTLATMFGISHSVVNSILRGRAWRHATHITPPEHRYTRSGATHHLAKLTPDAVRELRQLALTHSFGALAKRYGLDKATIVSAIQGKTWKHVE